MNEEQHKKYGMVELLIGIMFYLVIDILCALIDSIGIGLIISPVIQSFATFTMTMWALSKGDKNALKLGRQIAKYAVNFLPLLPTLTIVFLIETFIHNHPKITKITKPGLTPIK